MTPLEIALERIEACRRSRATELDLSGLGLEEIPEAVFELTWLEKLDVSGDKGKWEWGNIREIPAAIEQLTALTAFDCTLNEISDLSALSVLPALQSLSFGSNQISDLSALSVLLALQSLTCWYNQISDLSALSGLLALQSLDCSANQISDLSALSGLPALQSLDCGSNQISHLTLSGLPALQSLDCGSNQISDLSPLSGLPALQSLDCSDNQISDLSGLAHVRQLQTFDCGDNKISDLSGLAHIPQLQTLSCYNNNISDLSGLAYVPQLQSLHCDSNKISDLSGLAHVPQLKTLNCYNNKISDLSSLAHVPQLQSLHCEDNEISDLSPIDSLLLSGQLKNFYFYGNPKSRIPTVLLSNYVDDNCLENIQHYRQAILTHGSITQKQLKIQLVGNGRVGKTTLAIALETGKPVDQDCESTHGITISTLPMMLHGETEPLNVQLWDFGGQEIYHATHRLFLANDCLYLLLWAEETPEQEDETRHPVTYWLESIHDLSPDSTVIVVKNRIDLGEKQPDRPDLSSELPGYNQIQDYERISARKYRRIGCLKETIKEVIARELQDKVTVTLPKSWVQVQEALEKLKSEQQQTTILFPHFQQLCLKAGVDYAEWFLDYLHKTGALFYREGAFQDQIILDQNWVINAVYRVFDPQDCRDEIEERRGRFKGKLACKIWPEVADTEREIYLDFMRNCGICYEPNRHQNDQENRPFADRKFTIPALLPLTSKAKTAWGAARPDDWQLDIEYPFLHRSIIERIILRLGETFESEPWRTGIFCTTDEGQVLLECEYTNKQQSTQGRLHFQLRGQQLNRLVYMLRKLVSETSPHRRYSEFLSQVGKTRTQLPEFEYEDMEHTSRLDETKPADKTVKLFISYSHADEAHKIRLEKHLKAINRTLPLTVWSDRHLFAGEAVDEQIFQQLNTADIVLLMVSPDFINSDYCFTKEMERALQRYHDEGNVVIPVIIRHTANWRNHKIGQIVALPKDGKPLKQWDDEDEFWGSVEDGIRAQVEKLLKA